MKSTKLGQAFFFLLLLLIKSSYSNAQQAENKSIVEVTGLVTQTLHIGDKEFQAYPQIKVSRKDKDGNDHIYEGVLLSDILQKAGVTLGADLKGKNLKKCLLVSCKDGYQVTFALAELDKAYTDRLIILANKIDGKALAENEGPFRIIVQNEKKPARCAREVSRLKVISVEE